eukprot:CAMPEP_0180711620 /NCGR_PEP_ID=MMETSP1038_2-20121128/10948_1 /TAXON_ID=632150 /ORGANISM="Azadinium spinosum, Strain 3D9" /LENGTH=187 /DNA_ID=CAMNT_0022743855 /DNA_START=18 /DNA_END=582 /DNA_ORIENTATION=+
MDDMGSYSNGGRQTGNRDLNKSSWQGPSDRGGTSWRGGNNAKERSKSRARSPSVPAPESTLPVRVLLSHLPRDMEPDELQEIAAEFGKVLKKELHREGAYKCGWVEYASKAEAKAAVNELNDRRVDDWHLTLEAYMYPGGDAQQPEPAEAYFLGIALHHAYPVVATCSHFSSCIDLQFGPDAFFSVS